MRPEPAASEQAIIGRDRRRMSAISLPPLVAANAGVRRAARALLAALRLEGADTDNDGGPSDSTVAVAAMLLADAVLAASSATQDNGDASVTAPPEYTQMTCYLQSDESEVCTFDGVFCFDGKSPIVAVEHPIRDPERILDYTHSCQDFRYYEPSALGVSGCAYSYSFDRPYNAAAPIAPGTDFPLPLERRRWGPQNRNGLLIFKEVTPEEIWGPIAPSLSIAPRRAVRLRSLPGEPDDFDDDDSGSTRSKATFDGSPGVNGPIAAPYHASPSGTYRSSLVQDGPFAHETFDGLRVARRTRVGNRTIDWVDGSLWLAGIDGQYWQNPYHWWSKIGALYDAQRANATLAWGDHAHDGTIVSRVDVDSTPVVAAAMAAARRDGASMPADLSPIVRRSASTGTRNRVAFRSGRQWPLPPMDVVAFAGDGANVLAGRHKLNPWFKRTLELATQPQTQTYFNDMIANLDDWHYVCSTRGAIPGAKNKMFTGRADAWLWRAYAYEAAGLTARGISPAPAYPPRKVTVLARKGLNGRGIFNIDAALSVLNATGLPVELVPNMGALSFDQQVELMAGTGILIAPHGAHLANVMFLPAHAVVVEMFPYLMKKNTYRHLASMMDVHYMPIYSWELLPLNYTQFYGVQLMAEQYYYNSASHSVRCGGCRHANVPPSSVLWYC